MLRMTVWDNPRNAYLLATQAFQAFSLRRATSDLPSVKSGQNADGSSIRNSPVRDYGGFRGREVSQYKTDLTGQPYEKSGRPLGPPAHHMIL